MGSAISRPFYRRIGDSGSLTTSTRVDGCRRPGKHLGRKYPSPLRNCDASASGLVVTGSNFIWTGRESRMRSPPVAAISENMRRCARPSPWISARTWVRPWGPWWLFLEVYCQAATYPQKGIGRRLRQWGSLAAATRAALGEQFEAGRWDTQGKQHAAHEIAKREGGLWLLQVGNCFVPSKRITYQSIWKAPPCHRSSGMILPQRHGVKLPPQD
jgi:hypothetical protein